LKGAKRKWGDAQKKLHTPDLNIRSREGKRKRARRGEREEPVKENENERKV